DYYRQHIAPVVDGHQIEYVGYVAGPAKDRLLGGARALLSPLQDPEPFGLVLVEAMLCGTPVVATHVGAAPEVIDEGITGYCAASADDFPQQVLRSFALDRRRVRARAEERFSAQRMAREYAEVYERVVSPGGAGKAAWKGRW